VVIALAVVVSVVTGAVVSVGSVDVVVGSVPDVQDAATSATRGQTLLTKVAGD
jgi:hypothetical protein